MQRKIDKIIGELTQGNKLKDIQSKYGITYYYLKKLMEDYKVKPKKKMYGMDYEDEKVDEEIIEVEETENFKKFKERFHRENVLKTLPDNI